MRHRLADCPIAADCLCDCFSSELHDAITARAKRLNMNEAYVADEIMQLGLTVAKMLESGTLPTPTRSVTGKSKSPAVRGV
jgi:hypothetical protein